jgi:hypothetical protein
MNNLTISHTDEAMVQKFADAWNSGGVCQHYIPMPEGEDWYSWNISNWGTKWDFGKDEYDDPVVVNKVVMESGTFYEVNVSPNTAWSPPIDFYNHLMGLGYNVHASYFEPGMAFCGIYHHGYDNYVDYGGEKDMIPVAIWNDFGLDDFFEMIEE